MTSISLLQVGSRKGSSAWTTVSHWSRRSPNLPTYQSRLLVSILLRECEHSFSNKPVVITEPQSRTKSVKNFALSYSKETRPTNLAPWWPLLSPFPGQCCLVGSKNVPAKLQHFFVYEGEEGGSTLSERGFRGTYSKIRHTRCILLNIFVQDCSWATRKAFRLGFETVS